MAYTTILSEVDLLWNKHLLLLQEVAFISFLFFMHKKRIHLQLTKVKN